MDFISSNLPLILFFLVGFGLLLTEAFMPGFGVAGVLGIVLEVMAVYSTWIHYGAVPALILTLVILALIGVTVFFSYRSIRQGRLSRSALVLKDEEVPQADNRLRELVGLEGVTATPLRPAGQVELNGERVSAASGGEFLEKGARVRVTGVEGDHVRVAPVRD